MVILFYALPWPCGFLASRRNFKVARSLLASFKAETKHKLLLYHQNANISYHLNNFYTCSIYEETVPCA